MAETKLTKRNNSKVPERFNGKLKDISIPTILDYIHYSCIVHIKKDNDDAALFFKDGKLFDVRLNNITDINKIKEIEHWRNGSFNFCEWDTDIETKAEFIEDILYLAEKLKSSCTLFLKNLNHTGELHIENGIIKHAVFDKKESLNALKDFVNEKEGVIKMIKGSHKKGNLTLTFNDIETKYIQTIKKEEPMNVKKLNQSLETLKEDLGDAIIASVIWTSADGQSLASINPQPKAAALFNQISQMIIKTLTDSGFPGLNDYYLFDLKEGAIILVMLFEGYQWGIMVNKDKVQLGLLLNVAMPNAKNAFLEALK